uniref:Uncharacterized protein n=1 Tax=Ciona savignyi TaxID=51511 RepID=H2YEM6_CIOSA
MVYRMVTMATIDQQITERAAEKRRMEKMIMHQDKFKGKLAAELNKVVSPDELLHLLQTNAVDSVVENKENVISDEELHQLLDRSNLKWGESETSSADHTPMLTESPKARFQIISVSDKTISV